jgi:mono/diheme cytochrome c family protein
MIPTMKMPLLCCFALLAFSATTSAAPVAKWEFSQEEQSQLLAVGGIHRDVPGPRPPEFPDFDLENTAVKLDGSGARYTFNDTGAASNFDFTNGESLTLEAWVKLDEMRDGENQYVIGKGRTGAEGFTRDNQNWALRVRGQKSKVAVSFLFATPRAAGADKTDEHWHRWTTNDGFAVKSGWHHIAVAYKFGEPESVRGWIDGKPMPGTWDMGGTTKVAPIKDDDAIWIGSSMSGSPSNSFRGYLDSIAIHREVLDDTTISGRFRRVAAVGTGNKETARDAPAVMPNLGAIPADQVLVTFHEGMTGHDQWLKEGETLPKETMRWTGQEFLLPRLPQRYDAWGIRENWKPPVLIRMAGEVKLPAGRQKILLRSRGLSRLWIDGKLAASTKPLQGSPSGEEPITPIAKPPLPGLRHTAHRHQETINEIDIHPGPNGTCRVVLEAMAGGKKFRTEPGELTVAIMTADGKSYSILQPAANKQAILSLTDDAVTAALTRIEGKLEQFDNTNRRAAAASQDAFWKQRHDMARAWDKAHPQKLETLTAKNQNPIDQFLAKKLDQAVAAATKTPVADAKAFHSTVLPILRENCFRCHGDKDQGGLKLNSREAALKGGDSETPAIVPGNIETTELLRRIKSKDEAERMPPAGEGLSAKQINILEDWVKSGAAWPAPPLTAEQTTLAPVVDDAAFLRRASLDTIGLPAPESEVRNFLANTQPTKRATLIDELLADPRWSDHWMSYWQDLLAENPTLINATSNSTGPFRWYLYDALRDGKALDRLVTELMMMRGSPHEGGSAGFSLAAQNDSPYAAKGHILASAFLGLELQCARCHDSPYHSTKQKDLYSLAAMLERKPVTVPKTSTVPAAFFEKKARESLIKVTLKPGEVVPPAWPFAKVTGCADDSTIDMLLQTPKDSRERLAALVTAPQNTRFAQVVVNRIWRRLMGAGIVEPAHDWEGHPPSHPELLEYLAREFITHDYDVKHLMRLIMNSQAYQRTAVGQNLAAAPELRFFIAPERRRLTAEQIVDSFYAAAGQAMEVEQLTLDPDGRRASDNRLTLGYPKRS